MPMNREQRIGLLSRKNRGRLERPAFIAALSSALSRKITAESFLDLERTDELIAKFRTGYQASLTAPTNVHRIMCSASQIAWLLSVLACLSSRLPSECSFLLTKQSEFCGAVELYVKDALSNALELIQLDGDSLQLISMDGEDGLLLDWNSGDETHAYEFAVWGSRWAGVTSDCTGK